MTHDYPPVNGGGLARGVSELAEAVRDQFDVLVMSSRLRDHCADDRGRHAVAFRRARPWHTVTELRRADLVCAHWTFSFRRLSTLSALVGPWLGRRTVCIIHTAPAHCDLNRLRYLPGWARRAVLGLMRMALSRCAAVVALGPSHAAALRAAGFPVSHVLPLIVSLPIPDASEPRASARPTVGIAGELSRLKGSERIPLLLRSLTPDFSVEIAGAGPLAHHIARSVDRLPAYQRAAVTLRGWIDGDQMPGFYAGLDFLILPSRTEAQSRVVLEAMLAGVVVIVPADSGGTDSVVDDMTGVVVDPDNPASCRRRLIDLVHDPSRTAAIRARARQAALDQQRDATKRWRSFLTATAAAEGSRGTPVAGATGEGAGGSVDRRAVGVVPYPGGVPGPGCPADRQRPAGPLDPGTMAREPPRSSTGVLRPVELIGVIAPAK
jgi:glycosyltransferase involved in cell wall biosynthesis